MKISKSKKKQHWGTVIKKYPMKYIIPAFKNNKNPRLDPLKSYKPLVNSIKKWGVIGAIAVTPLHKTQNNFQLYEIIDGDKTYLAAKDAGLTKINIAVYEGPEADIDALRLALNRDSEIPLPDRAKFIYETLIQKHGMSITELASVIYKNKENSGRAWISYLVTIAHYASPKVFDAWSQGTITKTHALFLARRFKEDQDKQDEFLDLILQHKVKTSVLIKLFDSIKDDDVLKEEIILQAGMKIKPKLRPTYYEIWKRMNQLRASGKEDLVKEYEWLFKFPTNDQ